MVELKCDGLDNDCDGRIDKSSPRVFFVGDGGQLFGEMSTGTIYRQTQGWMTAFDNELIWLDDRLNVTNQVTLDADAGFSFVLPDGDEWVRVFSDDWLNPIFNVDTVRADGGVTRVARVDVPIRPAYRWLRFNVLATANGWAIATTPGFQPTLIDVSRDGGVNVRHPEIGTAWLSGMSADSFFIQSFNSCRLFRCSPEADGGCEFIFEDLNADQCRVVKDNPLVLEVRDFVTAPTPRTALRYRDGGLYWPEKLPYAVGLTNTIDGEAFLISTRDNGVFDQDLYVLRPTQKVVFETETFDLFTAYPGAIKFRTFDQTHGILLRAPHPPVPVPATGGDFEPIGAYEAEYVCLPPP